jgi:hypothetical protein
MLEKWAIFPFSVGENVKTLPPEEGDRKMFELWFFN